MSLPDVTKAAKEYGDKRAGSQRVADQAALDNVQTQLAAALERIDDLLRQVHRKGPKRRTVLALGTSFAALALVADPAAAAGLIVLGATLDKPSYNDGDTMTLTVTENVVGRVLRVSDKDTVWSKQSDNGNKATYTATFSGPGSVTVTLTRKSDGATSTATVSYAGGNPKPSAALRYGMSAPKADWPSVLADVQGAGGKLRARRLFVGGFSQVPSFLTIARAEWAAGRLPVMSLSVDTDTEWQKFADGRYDAALRTMINQIVGNGHPMAWAIQHEPIGDGTAPVYAAMQQHVAPMFADAGISFGPIFNGYAWSDANQGMSDAEISAWIPDSLIGKCDFIAADCYHGGTSASPGETAGVKIRNLSAWADRHGATRLGVGEFSGLTAAAITTTGTALRADDRYAWACVFNSSRNNRPGVDWTLKGDRLTAFQALL